MSYFLKRISRGEKPMLKPTTCDSPLMAFAGSAELDDCWVAV
jgi:hypothetical protein